MEPEDYGLSARQLEVLRLIARNYSSKEAGRILGISAWTVEAHAREARKKLGGLTRRDAARWIQEYDAGRPERAHRPVGAQADFTHPSKAATPPPINQGPYAMGTAEGDKRRAPIATDSRTKGAAAPRERPSRPTIPGGMFYVVVRYLLDAFYVTIFFTVMSAVAYGAHLLVRSAEEARLDGVVVLILRAVEILLSAIDGVGVVIASSFLTYRFIRALVRIGD